MAKISVEFDTSEKTLSVSLDGKAVDNVTDVYLSRSYSEKAKFGCAITCVADEADGMVAMNRIVATEAAEDPVAVKFRAEAAKAADYPSYVPIAPAGPAASKAQADIAKFFGVA